MDIMTQKWEYKSGKEDKGRDEKEKRKEKKVRRREKGR